MNHAIADPQIGGCGGAALAVLSVIVKELFI
jgi:hypothetical protein